jgi:hypothetical protein
MSIDWPSELSQQLDFYWQYMVRPRLSDLGDDEYFWEPVEGCWSIRPVGDGTFACDWEFPEPSPPPVTTIAWRMAHMATGVFGMRAANHFRRGPCVDCFTDGEFDFGKVEWPGSASAGLRFLEDAYTAWRDGVRDLGEKGLHKPCGPAEGPYAQYPMATLILHINREVFHHAAEVALLRDLYRARS